MMIESKKDTRKTEIHLKTGQAVGLWPNLLNPTKREEMELNMDRFLESFNPQKTLISYNLGLIMAVLGFARKLPELIRLSFFPLGITLGHLNSLHSSLET
ncbi:hypothetical protein LguiB_027648 [Lonicera macranthoides]